MKAQWLYSLAGEVGLGFFDAGLEEKEDDSYLDLWHRLLPGPGNQRYSALTRQHLGDIDVFESRDAKGDLLGLCLVRPDGSKSMLGERGLGYFGSKLIASMPTLPYILVEGPYDVIDGRHVCAFGIPTKRIIRMFKGHFLILCPDGDVWNDLSLLRQFKRIIDYASNQGVFILGFHRLPPDKDPDEVPVKEREFIEL